MHKKKDPLSSSFHSTAPCGRLAPTIPKISRAESEILLQRLLKALDSFVLLKGLRRSKARNKILEIVVFEARHFRAGELFKHLHRKYPEVGMATLYRSLPILVEAGLLREGPSDPSEQAIYELADGTHHDHIVCLDCRGIFEFHDPIIEDQQEKISEHLSFSPRTHRHVIYATCDLISKRKHSVELDSKSADQRAYTKQGK